MYFDKTIPDDVSFFEEGVIDGTLCGMGIRCNTDLDMALEYGVKKYLTDAGVGGKLAAVIEADAEKYGGIEVIGYRTIYELIENHLKDL